jgi:L-alanine-DL-glutamate epimerase-like enolase superfamily enzyme
MRDGLLQVPTGPGLGVVLDEEAIAPHVVERKVIRRGEA